MEGAERTLTDPEKVELAEAKALADWIGQNSCDVGNALVQAQSAAGYALEGQLKRQAEKRAAAGG